MREAHAAVARGGTRVATPRPGSSGGHVPQPRRLLPHSGMWPSAGTRKRDTFALVGGASRCTLIAFEGTHRLDSPPCCFESIGAFEQVRPRAAHHSPSQRRN